MSEPFISQITMFAGNFAPQGWAFCDGQLLPLRDNEALYSLINSYYGGDGVTTVGLPDLRGRVPIGMGQGQGLSPRRIGQRDGTERATLTINQIPQHKHSLMASTTTANSMEPGSKVLGQDAEPTETYTSQTSSIVQFDDKAIANTGNGTAPDHENMAPFLSLSFIIALSGIYPARN
jgi:microcystin-dependent protein